LREIKAVNIKPILVSLEDAIEQNNLIEQMILVPEPASTACDRTRSAKPVNFVVGYNASPRSQTALALTMWIAHQTRLATQKQVTVQVVYVVDEKQTSQYPDAFNWADVSSSSIHPMPLKISRSSEPKNSITSVLNKPNLLGGAVASPVAVKKSRRAKATFSQSDWFEQADRILWQARCLAEEWRGSFKAHLRFGDVVTELTEVVASEAASLLFLGCTCAEHPLVQKLGSDFPCAVLGIPKGLCMH
jgi:nucleotide-binding universal stress UspA family protein